MDEVNKKVKDALEYLVHNEGEIGLQVAAYLDSKLVVDTWAGLADEATKYRVDGETLFTAFSISKGIVSTCIHILADRCLIDYFDPIAQYWPEFAAHGKSRATIRHALTHRLGIPNDPSELDISMMTNWKMISQAIADLKPLWEPGTKIGYHPLTYGWVLGEVIRRVDGRTINDFLQDEICRRLDITGIYFGIPTKEKRCVANLKNAVGLAESMSQTGVPLTRPMSNLAATFNLPAVRQASIPGAGALVNARSLARLYAMLAQYGELDGVRLLSRDRVIIASNPEPAEPEEIQYRWWTAHSLGYTLGGGPGLREGYPHSIGYEGIGTIGFADLDRGFAFAFLKNLLDMSLEKEMRSVTHVLKTVEEALRIK